MREIQQPGEFKPEKQIRYSSDHQPFLHWNRFLKVLRFQYLRVPYYGVFGPGSYLGIRIFKSSSCDINVQPRIKYSVNGYQ